MPESKFALLPPFADAGCDAGRGRRLWPSRRPMAVMRRSRFVVGRIATPRRRASRLRGRQGVSAGRRVGRKSLWSRAGAKILEQGGNAIDAARWRIAYALNVDEPQSPPAAALMMIHWTKTGESFRSTRGRRRRPRQRQTSFVRHVLHQRVDLGHRGSACRHGACTALAVERWGRLPLARRSSRAIALASDGLPRHRATSRQAAARAPRPPIPSRRLFLPAAPRGCRSGRRSPTSR